MALSRPAIAPHWTVLRDEIVRSVIGRVGLCLGETNKLVLLCFKKGAIVQSYLRSSDWRAAASPEAAHNRALSRLDSSSSRFQTRYTPNIPYEAVLPT